MEEKTLWGIHAGRTGDADTLFLHKKVVAIGWHEMGDLSQLAGDRETFKASYAKIYPHARPGAIRTSAGQIYRFAHEMQEGDLIAYPSKQTKTKTVWKTL